MEKISKCSEKYFAQKVIVFNVILSFLDHLKPKISFIGQPW